MPDRDDDPDGAGHSRSRSRMPDLEWLSSSDEGRLPAWISPTGGHLLAACHHGRSGVGRRENIQWLIQSWRMEEGRQIDQEVCGEAGARR
jgi:hypothetical protein